MVIALLFLTFQAEKFGTSKIDEDGLLELIRTRPTPLPSGKGGKKVTGATKKVPVSKRASSHEPARVGSIAKKSGSSSKYQSPTKESSFSTELNSRPVLESSKSNDDATEKSRVSEREKRLPGEVLMFLLGEFINSRYLQSASCGWRSTAP